jgi:hypothetical protein
MTVTTPSAKWVASRALDIIRVQPNIGTKELQTRLQNDPNIKCVIGYDTVARGKCDNPPRKIPYYRLGPIHFGH